MAQPSSGALTEELFLRFGPQIYGFCRYRLGDRVEAEDALQSTFLNAFQALERGVVPYSEAAWLFKIAENVCLSRHRSAYRRRRIESGSPPGDDVPSPEHDEVVIDFRRVLRTLPQRQRHALVLREWHGLAYAEIATQLGLSRGAVETLLHRARRTLRAAA